MKNNKSKSKLTAKGVENKNLTVDLTEGQKNLAVDNMLIHTHDGSEWLFFDSELPLLKSLIKANPDL